MLGSRWFAAVVSIALLGATLEPLIRAPWEDGFPLSPYPMFAFKRPTKLAMEYAFGVTATGERRTLTPRIVGSAEVLQALTVLQRAKSRCELPQLCTTIAARVADLDRYAEVTEIRIVTGTHDAVDFLMRDIRGTEVQLTSCKVLR
ncbi:MAG: hypothetical protein ABI175_04760 [Polyangiales bacterium]